MRAFSGPAPAQPHNAKSHFSFLLSLDDATRALTDPAEITVIAATQLGVHLQVNRCAYAEVESDENTFRLMGNYHHGVDSIAGLYQFADFGDDCLRALRAGVAFVVEDTASDARTQSLDVYRHTSIGAVICVPMHRSRRLVAAMVVHQREGRHWCDEDVDLLQLVASRCWESIERTRVARELGVVRNKLKAAINAAEIATWVWDLTARTISGDRNVALLIGRDQEEVIVSTEQYIGIVHKEDVDALLIILRECMRGERDAYQADYRIVLPDGRIRYVNARGRMERSAERGDHMLGVLVDVTSRRRIEDDLREAEQQLQQLNEALERKVQQRTDELMTSERQFAQLVSGVTDYALYMLDSAGHVTSWNPGAARIKGYSAEEIIGRHFSQFYTPEDRAAGLPALSLASVANHGKFEGEGWRMRKDGSRFWANVLIDPIVGPGRRLIGYAKLTRDMTERRAMQEQLQQSQKMEAIGQLTGGVAHDFNNLLTVILGNLDTIGRRDAGNDARVKRAIEHATRGAQRAAALTQQLLAFSRRQPLNPKVIDVNRLVSGMYDLLRRALPERLVVELIPAADLWHAEVDPNQLENAILNLAVNARDAMQGSGRMTIATASMHLDGQTVRHMPGISAGDYVMISVQDTGAGMSAEVISRAFDPFFTTKPIGEGTGLGLSQVFGFVRQSAGHVGLTSEIDVGTTVTIYLPRGSDDAVESAVDAPAETARARCGETILVVEDEDDVRAYSTEALQELGFTVLQAMDADSAVQTLVSCPRIDLLFTDVGLPGLNGRELVERARVLRPQLRVLFTSGYARDAIVHEGRLDAGVALLSKPFTRGQLAAQVRLAIDSPVSVIT